MLNTGIEVLKKIESNGYNAYIVGGFVRDKYLNIKSLDIDICTSATPKELSIIFKDSNLKNENYGSLSVHYKNIRFEITTFRKELKYQDARKPIKIEYIYDLNEDLKRRDFTMNTLCIDKDNNMIDIYNAVEDIKNKKIKTVGNPDKKFKEDALRILRAIRFMSQLDFSLEEKTKQAIDKNKELVSLLTNHRKKQELEKIFIGIGSAHAVEMIIELNLQKPLGIKGLENVTLIHDPIAIWAQLDFDIENWPFTKNEKNTILEIKKLLKNNEIDNYTLYKKGLYLCSIVYKIQGKEYTDLTKRYEELPIKSSKDINIKALEIASILNKEPSRIISKVLKDIEKRILENKIANSKEKLTKYILTTYK